MTKETGGAGRDRTGGLYIANVTLSQLSYGPGSFLAHNDSRSQNSDKKNQNFMMQFYSS